MKSKVFFPAMAIILTAIQLQGCSLFTIGEEEYKCPGSKSKVMCKGPREVYDLTNSRDDLSDLLVDPEDVGKQVKKKEPTTVNVVHSENTGLPVTGDAVVYKPRSLDRQHPSNYNKAEPIPRDHNQVGSGSEYSELRTFAEPPHDIAPEPLAILKPAKVMRVLVASYKDSDGDLHIPGYIYVDLEPRSWGVGRSANLAPSRIVPLETRKKAEYGTRNMEYQSKGVTGLGVDVRKQEK